MNLSNALKSLSKAKWYIASLIAGYAQAVSMAAPWQGLLGGQPLWWLQILSLSALVMLLDRAASARQAAVLGWLFATSWLCSTVWWLFISMHVYGGLAAPLAVLAILALCGFLALYYAAASYVYKRFRQIAGIQPAASAVVFAAAWMLAELARDTWFTGFPWGAGGYAHVDGPLKWMAYWVGVYGVGAIAAALAALLASLAAWLSLDAAGSRNAHSSIKKLSLFIWGGSFAAASLVVGAASFISAVDANSVFGFFTQSYIERMPPEVKVPSERHVQRTTIALLQGNISQGEKFQPSTGIKASLQWYEQQLMLQTASLVVTPETAIPVLRRDLPDGYWEGIQERFSRGNQAALVGIPLGDETGGYANAVVGLKPDQKQLYQYDKHHLVPFGEFIPPLFKWFTEMMNIPLGDFNRGAVGQPSFEWAGQRWALNICYEDLFGDELARRFVNEDTAPNVMVNVSNIGWFGNSIAIDQHLQISRMRALELGRPMVRATNTGATVIINHRGEITHSLPRHTRGVLTGSVEGRQGLSPFARWAGRFGLWPLWVMGTAMVLIAFGTTLTSARGRKNA
jgi:apolipoprotein N-acyltransferase